MPDHILRLRRTDTKGSDEYILVNISQSGSKPLDLKLVASEGSEVYLSKIKESSIKSLQASNYSGKLDDWKAVLKYALLQHRASDTSNDDVFDGLESVAAISEETLTIVLRKNISGITQRLGSIRLSRNEDEEEEISPFDWASTAAAERDALRDELLALQASVTWQQKEVATLNQQLDDLVKAKKQHEDELLRKFASLLNAKKLKIRDQQRLLAGAKIDSDVAGSVGGRKGPGSSRRGKRKANGAADALADEETATEDDDVDETLEQQEETPQHSDVENEDSADGFEAAPVPSQASRRGAGSQGRTREAATSKAKAVEDDGVPPPPRALPFSKKSNGKAAEPKKSEPVRTTADDMDDDDETDDDEL